MINAAQLQGKSSDFANKAYDTVQQSYGERAPLRAAGIEGMLRPVPSSDVQQIGLGARATNPFATKGPLPFQKALTPTAVPGAVPPVPQNPNPTAGVGFNGFPEGLALSGVGRTAQRV